MQAQLNLPADCHNLFQSTTATRTGTVTFADGMETDNSSLIVDASVLFTEACASADVEYPIVMALLPATAWGRFW